MEKLTRKRLDLWLLDNVFVHLQRLQAAYLVPDRVGDREVAIRDARIGILNAELEMVRSPAWKEACISALLARAGADRLVRFGDSIGATAFDALLRWCRYYRIMLFNPMSLTVAGEQALERHVMAVDFPRALEEVRLAWAAQLPESRQAPRGKRKPKRGNDLDLTAEALLQAMLAEGRKFNQTSLASELGVSRQALIKRKANRTYQNPRFMSLWNKVQQEKLEAKMRMRGR